jgi:hypothetical protein
MPSKLEANYLPNSQQITGYEISSCVNETSCMGLLAGDRRDTEWRQTIWYKYRMSTASTDYVRGVGMSGDSRGRGIGGQQGLSPKIIHLQRRLTRLRQIPTTTLQCTLCESPVFWKVVAIGAVVPPIRLGVGGTCGTRGSLMHVDHILKWREKESHSLDQQKEFGKNW